MKITIQPDNQPEQYLECQRCFVFTGSVADMPNWFQDKIVHISQPIDIGEVWTGWNKRKSLTIRCVDGYKIADVGSLIIDLGKDRWHILPLTHPMWGDESHRAVADRKAMGTADDGTEDTQASTRRS